jgi:hypothetical protein
VISSFQIEISKSGLPVILVNGRYLHSKYNPITEAQRRWKEVDQELFRKDNIAIFIGAGIGYIVEIFLNNRTESAIWIEPNAEILKAALDRWNPETFLKSGQLQIIRNIPSETELIQVLKGFTDTSSVLIPHHPSMQFDSVYEDIYRICEKFLFKKNVNMATMSKFDKEWTHNFFNNLPFLAECSPLSDLIAQKRFSEKKIAIVCGAGPSLFFSLDDIKSLRKDALLIAVDTSVHILLKSEIDPDIIVSVDPQTINSQYLEGYYGDAVFVIDPMTSYQTLHRIPLKRTYYCWNPFPIAEILFKHIPYEIGKIAFGGSVSTNAYDLAVVLGFTNIILAGQDLSFSYGQAHCKGALLEERLNYKESRLTRRELNNFRQFNALPVQWLPSVTSEMEKVPTNAKLSIFYDWFSKRIQSDLERGISVFNLGDAGARIPAVVQRGDFLEKYRNDQLSIHADKRPYTMEEKVRQKIYQNQSQKLYSNQNQKWNQKNKSKQQKNEESDGLKEAIKKDLINTYTIIKNMEEILKENIVICQELVTKRKPAKKSLDRLSGNDEKMRKILNEFPVISFASQEILLRLTEQYKVASVNESDLPIENSLELYQSLLKSSYYLKRKIPKVVQLLGGLH